MINKKIMGLAAVAIAALMLGNTATADQRYVINYKNKMSFKKVEATVEAAGGTIVRSLPQVNVAIAVGPDAGFADSLESVRGIDSVGTAVTQNLPAVQSTRRFNEADMPENGGPTGDDWAFNAGLTWGIDRVHAPQAWDAGNTGSHDTLVAVIDTGVAWNHPDLTPNVVQAYCAASGPCSPYPRYSMHGTHVAGTIAAAFGGGGVVGVGPDLGIIGYNVFEPIEGCGVCAYSDTRWFAMLHAADSGVDVINMSLGGYGEFGGPGSNGLAAYLQAEKKVANYVRKAGTTIIASSGNGGLWLNGRIVHTPSDIPSIVGVAATGIQPDPYYPQEGSFDIRAFYSNYGAASTVSAPGGDCGEIGDCTGTKPLYWYHFILSSGVDLYNDPALELPYPACADTYDCPTGYWWMAGTSMASPHVAGVAGLIADKHPGMSPQEITEILKETADKVGNRQEFGHGIVNADAATQ